MVRTTTYSKGVAERKKKMRLNKECMVCGGELWILEDEVEFYPNQYLLGRRIGVDRETVRCKCTTCGTEYTIEGEYRNIKELKAMG